MWLKAAHSFFSPRYQPDAEDPDEYETYGRIMLKNVPTNLDLFDKIIERRTMSHICSWDICVFHMVNLKL